MRKALVTHGFSLYLLHLVFVGKFCLSIAADRLTNGQALSGTETIVSEEGIFELGFFYRGYTKNIYLGIWYKEFQERPIVWIANREAPISSTSSTSSLQLYEDGNLVLLNESGIVWSTNLMFSRQPSPAEAVLLDNGNLVLRESSNTSSILWQSFDHPTDTWLPGAKFGFKILAPSPTQRLMEPQRLISWKNPDDPSPGMFSAVVDTDTAGGQILLQWNKSEQYWTTGIWTDSNGTFKSVPDMSSLAKFSLVSTANGTYYTYSLYYDAVLSRLVMDASGSFKLLTAPRSIKTWTEIFTQPRDPDGIYDFCGAFSVSSPKPLSSCSCLQGFAPINITGNERKMDVMRGCQRKAPRQCQDNTSPEGNNDGFLPISNLKSPDSYKSYTLNAAGCESACSKDCSCTAYSYDENGCRVWRGALLNLKDNSDVTNDRHILYLKLANSQLQDTSGHKKRLMVIIAVAVSLLGGPALGGLACLGIRRLKQRGHGSKGRDLLSFKFSTSDSVEESAVLKQVNNVDEHFDLPSFSYASVSAATDNFSEGNKLGEGGFGPVYKGKLLKGQEIAVKRLSRKSGQGLEEFQNEILLIAKLQHRNLVRLLGCCIDKDEKILIYEYMPNKSLDSFLFEAEEKKILDWRTRACIIEGIAQGLLYLHQHSRLRIIHRDLKAGNILLDHEMNPKISDFGMARIFCGNTSEANTNRIVGTYGYMAPEYALGGLFSIKSDVFSFGVLVLEIVSGKKNTGFYYSDTLHLLAQAWELWNSNRAPELMDPSLNDDPPAPTLAASRSIHIGLLCVQENPNDRPTMSDVVLMLASEHIALPSPKQPAFMANKIAAKTTSSNNAVAAFSINGLTVSSIEPR